LYDCAEALELTVKVKFLAPGLGIFLLGVAVATAAVYARNPLIPPAFYAVQGAPFTAMIESVWEGSSTVGPGRESTKVVRDTAGRERFESPSLEEAAVTGEPVRIDIYDVVKETMIQLDPQRKTAIVRHMDRMSRPTTVDLSVNPIIPPHPAKGGEYLGMQSIAGQEAWGEHLVQTYHKPDGHTATTVRDLWLSTVYKMPLMQVREDVGLGRLTQQVTRFDAGEPNESLFEIPAGYAVVGR
jgi:hypothetical protein